MNIPRHWHVKEVAHIGVGCHFDDSVEVGTAGYPVEQLYIGDHVTLLGPSRFMPKRLVIGDYTKLYEMWCGGAAERNGSDYEGGDALFGHNVWMGPRCIADPTGGVYLGSGFGAGHETHIWSHIRHGDVLSGCQYLSYGRFVAEHDVWLVGRCTTNPVWCEPYSVAMTSSQVVRDMKRNRVYAGNPAVDITDKMGPPWKKTDLAERQRIFEKKLKQFHQRTGASTREISDLADRFDLVWRVYDKQNDPREVQLMKFLLPECKFTPMGQEFVRSDIIPWPSR